MVIRQKNLVSVMLTSFFGEPFLSKALDSLLAQDYPDVEIIILDDILSPQQTKEVGREYARRYPDKIRFYLDETHRITHEASNKIVEYVRGEYCMLAGDDDLWDPTYISTLVTILHNNPDVGMACSNGLYINGRDEISEKRISKTDRLFNRGHSQSQMFRKFLYHRQVTPMVFGLFRTEVYKQALPFDPFDGLEDADNLFLLKFFTLTKIESIDQPLYIRRVDHRSSAASQDSRKNHWATPREWFRYTGHQWKFTKKIFGVIRASNFDFFKKMSLFVWTLLSMGWYVSGRYLIICILWNKPFMLKIRKKLLHA